MFPIIDKKRTGIHLRKIMDERGVSVKDVQKYLGLGCVQSVYRWLDGVNMPTIDNLYALSELLQVPIDTIVRGNRSVIVSNIIMKTQNSKDRRLGAYYEKMQDLFVA